MRERERDLHSKYNQANPFANFIVFFHEILELIEIPSWVIWKVLTCSQKGKSAVTDLINYIQCFVSIECEIQAGVSFTSSQCRFKITSKVTAASTIRSKKTINMYYLELRSICECSMLICSFAQ